MCAGAQRHVLNGIPQGPRWLMGDVGRAGQTPCRAARAQYLSSQSVVPCGGGGGGGSNSPTRGLTSSEVPSLTVWRTEVKIQRPQHQAPSAVSWGGSFLLSWLWGPWKSLACGHIPPISAPLHARPLCVLRLLASLFQGRHGWTLSLPRECETISPRQDPSTQRQRPFLLSWAGAQALGRGPAVPGKLRTAQPSPSMRPWKPGGQGFKQGFTWR